MSAGHGPAGDAPVLPLLLLGIGGYLAWFGVHYWRDKTTAWPTDPVKAVMQGKAIPAPSSAASATADLDTVVLAAATTPTSGGGSGTGGGSGGTGSGGGGSGTTPGGVSGGYTITTLQSLWTANGGDSGTSFEAANVAMAESSGDATVTSSNPDGGTNVGLWQLDTRGEGAGYTVAQLQNPLLNAKITVMKTGNGANWSAWATPGC